MPVLVASAMCGNALNADTVTVTFTNNRAADSPNTGALPANLASVNFDGLAAFGITGTAFLPSGADTLTFTGGTNGATLSYVTAASGIPGLASNDGSVFAIRYIQAITGLEYLNISNLTFTGGNRLRTNGMAAGGGAYLLQFKTGQTVTISNSDFVNNSAKSTGASNEAGGGGLNLNNNNAANGTIDGIPNADDVHAILNKVNIKNNSTETEGDLATVWGGGLSLTSFETIGISNSEISGNSATAKGTDSTAIGGGIAIFNHIDNSTPSVVKISDTIISGNVAESVDGIAVGGGLWLEDNAAVPFTGTATGGFKVTLTDVDFKDNVAKGKTGTAGGAIWADENTELTIEAKNRDVLFSGNTVIIDSVTKTNSISAAGNVTYNAAAGRKITDNDGITVGGDVTKNGDGEAALIGGLIVGGKLDVAAGTLTIDSIKDNEVKDFTGNGTLAIFGDGDVALKVDGTNNFDGNIEVRDSFSVYGRNGGESIVKTGIAASVNISDGYTALVSLHNFNAGYKAVQDHFISGRARIDGLLGQAADCDPCNSYSNSGKRGGAKTRSIWLNYVGRDNSYQSNTLGRDWNITSNGVQLGIDLYRTNNNQLGVLGGYEKTTADAAGAVGTNSVESDDAYVGIYAAHVFSRGSDLRAVVNFGWQGYDLNRYTLVGRNPRYASFNGKTTEVNLEFGKRIYYRTSGVSFRPVVGVDVYVNNVGIAEENGFKAGTHANAVRYNGLSYTQTFFRVGSDLQYERKRVKLNGGLFYSYDLNDNTLKASVTGVTKTANWIGTYTPPEYASSMLLGSDLGRQIITVNFGGSFEVTKRSELFAGFTGNAYVDRDGSPFQSVGYIGGLLKW